MSETYIIIFSVILVVLVIIIAIIIWFYKKKKNQFKRDVSIKEEQLRSSEEILMMKKYQLEDSELNLAIKEEELRDTEESLVEVNKKLEVNKIGSNIHLGITKFINEGVKVEFLTDTLENTFNVFLKWREKFNPKDETCGLTVRYKKCLNKTDYICEINGIKYLVDFKTEKLQKRVKPLTALSWLVQLLSYKRALLKPDKIGSKKKDNIVDKSIKINKVAILHLSEQGYHFYVWDGGPDKKEIEKSILNFNDLKISINDTLFKKKVRDGFIEEEFIVNKKN